MSSKKILITGATGFIGQQLLSYLNFSKQFDSGDISSIKIVSRNIHPIYETVVCDLQCEHVPDDIMDDVDTVFHLAGYAHDLREPSKSKNLYHTLNVGATLRLAELAVKSGVKHFVFISSVKAGGKLFTNKCANEMDQGMADNIYGQTKKEAEIKLLNIGRNSNMHVSIIRPSLVYGPNAKGNLRLMLSNINKGLFPPIPDTQNRKSMIHVNDLVRAIMLVAKDERANGEIFIVTDGKPYSSRDIYKAMCVIVGKPVPKWNVPKFIIDIAAKINPKIKYKLDKLFGDECYSSAKIEALGFRAKKTLKDMNKTSF
jgi:nucleoside-diphosphate-sugar epimerase